MNELAPKEFGGEFLLYQTENGRIRIETRMQEETVWLTQNQMTEMFQTSKQNISQHVKAIYESGELELAATVANFAAVQTEGPPLINLKMEYYKE